MTLILRHAKPNSVIRDLVGLVVTHDDVFAASLLDCVEGRLLDIELRNSMRR